MLLVGWGAVRKNVCGGGGAKGVVVVVVVVLLLGQVGAEGPGTVGIGAVGSGSLMAACRALVRISGLIPAGAGGGGGAKEEEGAVAVGRTCRPLVVVGAHT